MITDNNGRRNIVVESDLCYGIIGCIVGALVANVFGVIIAVIVTSYFVCKHLKEGEKQYYYQQHPEAFLAEQQNTKVEYISKKQAREEAIKWATMMLKDSKRICDAMYCYDIKLGESTLYFDKQVVKVAWLNKFDILLFDDPDVGTQDIFKFLNKVLNIAKDYDASFFVTTWDRVCIERWLIKTKSGEYYLIQSRGLADIINKQYGTEYVANNEDNKAKGAE